MCVLNLFPAMDLDDDQRLPKRRKTKQPKTGMQALPNEIIVDILSRLPITSLVQFKFVCKGWRALAQDPLLAADMQRSCTTLAANPCLILHCDLPIRNHLYFVDLSPHNQDRDKVFTLGTSAWRSLGKIPCQLVRRPSEALVSGRLHWVSRPRRYYPARRIMSFDIGDEEFREVPKPDSGGLNRCNFHLCVLGGCLAAGVYGNYGKVEIWVMKDYNVKESWTKELSIGAYMPKCLKRKLDRDRPLKIWKNGSNGKVVRVLCVLDNGEILLEYKNRVLVSYDPNKGKFTDLVFQGIPQWFQTVVHAASFNWINTLP
ncbi:hypothetical protein V6N13_062530 [Hibiscus sabdariffa]